MNIFDCKLDNWRVYQEEKPKFPLKESIGKEQILDIPSKLKSKGRIYTALIRRWKIVIEFVLIKGRNS